MTVTSSTIFTIEILRILREIYIGSRLGIGSWRQGEKPGLGALGRGYKGSRQVQERLELRYV